MSIFQNFDFYFFGTMHGNWIKLYRKKVYIVHSCNVKLFFDLSKNCQNYARFKLEIFVFCTRYFSESIHRNSTKLYRKEVYVVKLCNVKLFFHLSKNCQNYVNFFNFWYAHFVRAISPTLFITIQSNFTERIHIGWSCATSSCFSICQKIVKIMSIFLNFNFYFFRHNAWELNQTLQEKRYI